MTDIQVADFNTTEGAAVVEQAGRPLRVNKHTGVVQVSTPRGIVVNSLLRKDEWEEMDSMVMEAAVAPLRLVNDLTSRGLVRQHNSIGVQLSTWSVASEMDAASISMTGRSQGNEDRQEFDLRGVPIPITWKDFTIGTRELEASRRFGETVDVTNAQAAARVVSEKLESMLLAGDSSINFGSSVIYGYTNHPHRATDTATNYGGGSWVTDAADSVLTVQGMISAAKAQNHYGPYVLYLPLNLYSIVAHTYPASLDISYLQRLLSWPEIQAVVEIPTMTSGQVLLVQMTRNVVEWGQTWSTRLVEWVSPDGWTNHFRVVAIQVPRIKSDYSGNSGIVHATGAS